MEQKHTPTPWRVVNGNLIKDEFMPFDRDEAETALIATAAGHTTARTEANATFIVRACNAHDQLVHAVTMIRDADNDARRDGLQRIPPTARAAIDAALAAAGAV